MFLIRPYLNIIAIFSAACVASLVVVSSGESQTEERIQARPQWVEVSPNASFNSASELVGSNNHTYVVRAEATLTPQSLRTLWGDYHRLMLPIAVAVFFWSFGLWSLITFDRKL